MLLLQAFMHTDESSLVKAGVAGICIRTNLAGLVASYNMEKFIHCHITTDVNVIMLVTLNVQNLYIDPYSDVCHISWIQGIHSDNFTYWHNFDRPSTTHRSKKYIEHPSLRTSCMPHRTLTKWTKNGQGSFIGVTATMTKLFNLKYF